MGMRKSILWLLMLVLFLCVPGTIVAEESASSEASVASGAAAPVLREGDKGPEVLEMKKRLQVLRYIESGNLTRTFTAKTAASLRSFQQVNGLEETGELDLSTRELLFSDRALPLPHPTLAPLATPAPLPDIPWPDTTEDGFLTAGGEFVFEDDQAGVWISLTDSLRIEITRREDSSIPLVWFETEIRTRNGVAFETVATDPAHPGKKFRYPADIAQDAGFILGFSDDFYATRIAGKDTVGIIIRDGSILSDTTYKKRSHHLPNLDMMAQYPDGRLAVYECNEHTAQELLEMGAVNVFSFGPILLRDGEINEQLYTWYRSVEPRHALGMIAPNHYLLISIQGRTKASKGTMLQRLAEMMKDRGVTQALNLDGGNTMALVFRGRMLNKMATYKNRRFVRSVTSLIGIGHMGN